MTPSPNGHNRRSSNGRFTVGNAGGPGNPHAAQVGGLRRALLDAVTPDDVRDIAAKLVTLAKGGDLNAMRLVLDRTVGKKFVEQIESPPTLEEYKAWLLSPFRVERCAAADTPDVQMLIRRFVRVAVSDVLGFKRLRLSVSSASFTLITNTAGDFNKSAPSLVNSVSDRHFVSGSAVAGIDRKSTRLNSSHHRLSRMPSSA